MITKPSHSMSCHISRGILIIQNKLNLLWWLLSSSDELRSPRMPCLPIVPKWRNQFNQNVLAWELFRLWFRWIMIYYEMGDWIEMAWESVLFEFENNFRPRFRLSRAVFAVSTKLSDHCASKTSSGSRYGLNNNKCLIITLRISI